MKTNHMKLVSWSYKYMLQLSGWSDITHILAMLDDSMAYGSEFAIVRVDEEVINNTQGRPIDIGYFFFCNEDAYTNLVGTELIPHMDYSPYYNGRLQGKED